MTGSTVQSQKTDAAPLPKGYLFNGLLFLIFFLPVYDLATFKLGPVITNMREVCLVLLPAVYFLYPPNDNSISLQTKYWIILFLVVLGATELLKKEIYGLSLFDTVKNFRIALPLLSGLLICIQGKKIDGKACLKTIFLALIISYLLTPLLALLGIQPSTFSVEGKVMEVGIMNQGRLANSNYEFALIGIALLFYIPKVQTVKKGLKKLILIASALSVLILILTFNRTILAAGALLGFILLVYNLEARTIGYIIGTMAIVGGVAGYFYFSNPAIQRQVDNRILVVFKENDGLTESVYYGNRDKLYDLYLEKLNDFWMLGMPGGEALIVTENIMSSKSDISFFNIWIRYGLVPLIIFTIILVGIYADQRKRIKWMSDYSLNHQLLKAVIVTFPFYILISLNVDALVADNAILFLLLFTTFSEVDDTSPLTAENN